MNKKDELIDKQAELIANLDFQKRHNYEDCDRELQKRLEDSSIQEIDLRKEIASLTSEIEAKGVVIDVVRGNLMNQENYSPYCGNPISRLQQFGCSNPRTHWSKEHEQFVCPECGWVSQFPKEFIEQYKAKWHCEAIKSEKPEPVSADSRKVLEDLLVAVWIGGQKSHEKGGISFDQSLSTDGSSMHPLHMTVKDVIDTIEKMLQEYATLRAAQGKGKEIKSVQQIVEYLDNEVRLMTDQEYSTFLEFLHNEGTNTIYDFLLKRLESLQTPVQSVSDTFTRKEIEQLQSVVYEITGKGEVMKLFNKLLGVQAG